ncbi:MAG: prepilin peptidase [Promethearchaeota archaeon]
MLSLILIIDFIFITIILFFSLYFDLKFRKISNKYLKLFFLIGLFLNFLELLVFFNDLLLILFLKILYLFIIVSISLLLFSLKIIGGGDGKVIILIFLVHPIKYLNFFFIISFFLLFSLLFFILFFINFIFNKIVKNSCSFDILFNFYGKVSIFKILFLKMFYRFNNLSEIKNCKGNKNKVKCLSIFYNSSKNKFQYLTQYRPPLVLICIFSYYTIFFIIGI